TGMGVGLTLEERQTLGEQARARTDPGEYGPWRERGRPDPVALLEAQNATRDPDLVPVRHGRMIASPFTFYRGTATVMASDLATTPTAGVQVQLCGDAHLSNFGAYGSPDRELVFDLNDFDETLPGPFEYDVKRLAASFTIAAQNNDFSRDAAHRATITVAKAYRKAMAQFAEMSTMDLWYSRMSEDDLAAGMKDYRREMSKVGKNKKHQRKAEAEVAQAARRGAAALSKARTRTSLQALSKLTEVVDGRRRIVSQPPAIIPLRELGPVYGLDAGELRAAMDKQFSEYRSTLSATRRRLLDRFEFVDIARKVVGVGSVGTRAFVVLLRGRDERDPLFLQIKEATNSVLEAHLPRSEFTTAGERVVQGQQMMQAASDIFLGWSEGIEPNRYYYWRQLRDMKGSVVVETILPTGMNYYAKICGWSLARAHARSGDAVAIAAYLGTDKRFEEAVAEFSTSYADQNERDYHAFREAIDAGRIEATLGV
ncbi:MAG TPA: DUF2252 domain-containing protein, partial [Nocardioidaceae bacterium]|nr:DUF2252 domain-containing protein [Nocardioidaceae bacterium]